MVEDHNQELSSGTPTGAIRRILAATRQAASGQSGVAFQVDGDVLTERAADFALLNRVAAARRDQGPAS
jgi:hypothetical protein